MRYDFIQRNRCHYSVERMCTTLKVSKANFYKWKSGYRSNRERENEELTIAIKIIHQKSRQTYGSPRITQELNALGEKVSTGRIARLMKKEGIRSKVKKKYRVTTNSTHKHPVAANLLNREFHAGRNSQGWVSDITYIRTKQGWLYLTVVIDLFDRKVIGWSLSKTMGTHDTVVKALRMALQNRPVGKSILFHSDRGVQYASTVFTNLLKSIPLIKQSMSRKGNCWDNAVAESFFKTLKTELVYHKVYWTRKEAEIDIFEYIETWYNTNRRHSALNGKTINEFNQINYLNHAA